MQITPEGQAKIAPLIAQSRDHEAIALSGLSKTDIHRLKSQLRQLAQTR